MPVEKKEVISITPFEPKEKIRRKHELIIAALLFIVVSLTSAGLVYFGVDSVLFVVLININIILLLIILFLVVRNGIKLLLDRRKGVLGSKMRTRFVVTFMILSLVPTVLMFIVSARFVQTSVDYWFRNQVETSMELAMVVGYQYLDSISNELKQRSKNIKEHLKFKNLSLDNQNLSEFLKTFSPEKYLVLLNILTNNKEELFFFTDQAKNAWAEAKPRINFSIIEDENTPISIYQPGQEHDFVFTIQLIKKNTPAYLVLGANMPEGTVFRLDKIVQGLDEYKQMRNLKKPFKATFYFFLILIGLIITLGAMWFGLRLSKEIATPLLALTEGTEQIAKGNLSIRFNDKGFDELSLFIKSFNRMSEDLEQNRYQITSINQQLSSSNQELAARNKYIETILDSVAAGVISLDTENKISTVNTAACNIFNLEYKQLLGHSPLTLLKVEHATMVKELLTKLHNNPGSRWQQQISISHADSEWKLLVTASSLTDLTAPKNKSKGIVAVFEDITELEKMQRMTAWREVARRIAHEIKNPLTPIKLSAQRLKRKFGKNITDTSFTQCTDMIVSQVEYLQQMVEEFSAFAKLPEVNLKKDNLIALIQETLNLFKASHNQIIWELESSEQELYLLLDKNALSRAFINLFTNAVEAMQDCQEKIVKTVIHRNQHAVLIDIIDSGKGLNLDILPRIFEPYFSNKKTGTGLGLTIVKSIITDHKGYIRASASKEKGSTFTIELPLV